MPDEQALRAHLQRHLTLAATIGRPAVGWLCTAAAAMGLAFGLQGAVIGWLLLAGMLPLLSFSLFARIGARHLRGQAGSPLTVLTPHAAAAALSSQSVDQLLSKLTATSSSGFVLARLGLSPEQFPEVRQPLQLAPLLAASAALAEQTGDTEIGAAHLLVALIMSQPTWQTALTAVKLQSDDLMHVLEWQRRSERRFEEAKLAWRKAKVKTGGGLGGNWSSGATYTLDRYAEDITADVAEGRLPPLFGKTAMIASLEQALSKSEGANVILVGPAGVGKEEIVLGLAGKMASGQTVPALQYKRLLKLNVSAALSGANGQQEVESRLVSLLNESTRAGNIIIFINNLATLLGTGDQKGALGSINAGNLLLPYLQAHSIQLIGTATPELYRQRLEQMPELTGQFVTVDVPEPTAEDNLKIVEEAVPAMEQKNHALVTYQAVAAAVELADRYIHDVPFPEKAISLLDQTVVSQTALRNQPLITRQSVEQTVSGLTHVPVGEASRDEKHVLLNLENELHKRIIGQNQAIEAVADALRRARSGLSRGSRPIGSFLFIGPTGVGKTETAKALAAIYFGDEQAMLRFDMSEYQEDGSISRLIGGPGESGLLTQAVRTRPFALILIDEIEKSSPGVRDLFLQILDDGRLTDGQGRTVDFKNTLIIATSNAGAELVREALMKQTPAAELKTSLLDYLLRQGVFKPEFLNRFDGVVAFLPLTLEEVEQVVQLMLADINRGLTARQVTVILSAAAVRYIAETGFDPTLGARALRRRLQETVEDILAKQLLSGQVSPGQTITIDRPDLTPAAQIGNSV